MKPFHHDLLARLTQQREQDRLPHALLLTGVSGLGKFAFAEDFASLLLCKTGTACGQCKTCLLLAAGTHPDLYVLEPETAQIKVEQVRDIISWSHQTAQMGGMKVAIIHPAEQMNLSAANALLKCLEEPAAGTLIMLVSSRPSALLPTVRSRCQVLSFHVPERDVARAWVIGEKPDLQSTEVDLLLEMAGGRPLLVISMLEQDYIGNRRLVVDSWQAMLKGQEGPVGLVKKLEKQDLEMILLLLHDILVRATKQAFDAPGAKVGTDADWLEEHLANHFSRSVLLDKVARLERDLRLTRSTSNPNRALLLEALFIDLANA